ncbi:MAG: 2-hydroxychromene-2-carboxylate isomerase [Burkholderiaceae bacterium]
MTDKTIEYFVIPSSPFAYLGHDRFVAMARRHGAAVEVKPFDLGGKVFPISGGLPLPKRSPQRQAYRLVELERWSRTLGVPLNPAPRHFPVPVDDASLMIAAALRAYGNEAALQLAGAQQRAVWAEQRDISDAATLKAIAAECGLDGERLFTDREAARADYDAFTQQAIDRGVFGAPWYVYRGEPFWGQDRLDLLDRALAAA